MMKFVANASNMAESQGFEADRLAHGALGEGVSSDQALWEKQSAMLGNRALERW